MQNIIVTGISLDDFLLVLEKAIEKKINEKLESFKPEEPTKYLDRKEVAKLLKVSLVTISAWTKEGMLTSYRIGKLVRFRSDEVEAALIKRRFRWRDN